MAVDNGQFSNISLLVDELVVAQEINDDDKASEAHNDLLSELHTELTSLKAHLETSSSSFDKFEQCFVKLSRLASASSLSSSPLLISCCAITLKTLIEMDFISRRIQRDKLKADEYYTLTMDALTTKANLNYLQGDPNYTDNLYKWYTRLYVLLARETIRVRNRASELLNIQQWNLRTSSFEQKYKPFIKALLSFIDRQLNANEDISYEIAFFVSLSDDTNTIPDLVECKLPQHLKIWLSMFINNKELQNNDLCESILITMNNVARHEEGSNVLMNIHMNDTLKDFMNVCRNNLSTNSIAMYYMTYALIVTPDELKSETVLHDVIDYLIRNIHIASRLSTMRTPTAHISEYLVALARIVVNDNVAQYIINTFKIDATTDGLTFFIGLFQRYNDVTSNAPYLKHLNRIALFNILCSFSFQATAQTSLVSDKKFIEIIKNASHDNSEKDIGIQTYNLRHLSSVKQASEAMLINLDLYKDEDPIQIDASSKTTYPHIMISYSHKDVTFCRDLARALKSHSIDLWVDEDGHCLSDDCWEEIAVAIKNASTVLVIVSPSYCQSVSCRKEATYADKRKKTLIALYPNEDPYEPEEWLDIRLTGTYVRFGKKSFDHCISRLLEYIRPKEGNVINSIVSNTAPSIHSPPPPITSKQHNDESIIQTKSIEIMPSEEPQSVTITKSSIHEWTKQDVQTWFLIERNLVPQLYKLYSFVDGDSLLEYAKHFIQEHEQDGRQQYEKLHKRLYKEFNIEFYDNNYTDLVCSMKILLATYDQKPLSITQTNKQRSFACLLL